MKISEELMWKYVEGKCDSLESSSVIAGIKSSESTRLLYEEIKDIHVRLSISDPVAAPADLSRNVMSKIQSAPRRGFTSFNGLKLILGLSAMVMVAVYFLFEGGVIVSGTTSPLGPLSEIGVLDGLSWEFELPTYSYQVGLVLFGIMLCLLMDEILSARLGRKFIAF